MNSGIDGAPEEGVEGIPELAAARRRAAGLLAQVPPGLPASFQALTAPCYLHRAPRGQWLAMLILCLVLVLAGLAAMARLGASRPLSVAEWVFVLFLLFFLVVLARPSLWRPAVVLAADRQGLFFPGRRQSLLVPWSETGPFTIERTQVGEGVAESVVVTIATGSAFWRGDAKSGLARRRTGRENPPGFGRMPLGTQGIDPARTLASLEALRQLSGYQDAHPGFAPGPRRRAWELVVAGAFFLLLSLVMGAVLLRAVLAGQQGAGWIILPLLMAAFSGWVLRHGWRRRY